MMIQLFKSMETSFLAPVRQICGQVGGWGGGGAGICGYGEEIARQISRLERPGGSGTRTTIARAHLSTTNMAWQHVCHAKEAGRQAGRQAGKRAR
jgi:hypothetical protein